MLLLSSRLSPPSLQVPIGNPSPSSALKSFLWTTRKSWFPDGELLMWVNCVQSSSDNGDELDNPFFSFPVWKPRHVWEVDGRRSEYDKFQRVRRHVFRWFLPHLTYDLCWPSRRSKDACEGDSGGPLVSKLSGKQVGIVVWGRGCPDPDHPSIFTNLADRTINKFIASELKKWMNTVVISVWHGWRINNVKLVSSFEYLPQGPRVVYLVHQVQR